MSTLIFIIIGIFVIWLLKKVYSLWKLQQRTNTKGLGLPSIFRKTQLSVIQLRDLVYRERPKGFVHFWQGSKFTLVAIDPDAAKMVLKTPEFPKHKGITTASPKYIYDNFGLNLATANGDAWRRHRNVINSGFTTQAYQLYFPTFSAVTDKALSKMEEYSKKNEDIDLTSWFSKFTLDLLGKSIFHYDFGRLDDKSTEAYNSYYHLMVRFSTWIVFFLNIFPWIENLPFPQILKLNQCVDVLKTHFLQIIKERQNGKKHNDILENLLSSTESGGLSQTELISDIWAFFLAGHETTASALTWACVCLAQYQDIQEKVFQEIQNTVGNKSPTFDDLSKLNYLDCFISEVLRLFTPASLLVSRIAVEDVKYNDQVIPKGSHVGIYIDVIHKNPDFWPDPLKFDPDRFLPENKKGRNHYAYMPFSLGPRQCVGNNFSLIEQRLFLTRLLQKFRILPPKNSSLRTHRVPFSKPEPTPIFLEMRYKGS